LHSHRRRYTHISGESRCLQNHCPLKVQHRIVGQSDFWGASSRDCSPRTVTSSPAYYSPSIPVHQLCPSTSPPVPFRRLRTTTSWSCTVTSSTSATTRCLDRLLPEAVRLLLQ
jgi:hypothetical protein